MKFKHLALLAAVFATGTAFASEIYKVDPGHTFPINVKAEGGKQVFEGQLPIKRLAFNIGEGEWKDTSMVADEVVIKFRIAAGQ
jgi:polyisoprenoid-binding protein YceI